MPIFEYQCKKCETEFEVLVRTRSSRNTVKCTECGSRHTSKLMSTFAAHSSGGNGQTEALGQKSCSGCKATSCRGCK